MLFDNEDFDGQEIFVLWTILSLVMMNLTMKLRQHINDLHWIFPHQLSIAIEIRKHIIQIWTHCWESWCKDIVSKFMNSKYQFLQNKIIATSAWKVCDACDFGVFFIFVWLFFCDILLYTLEFLFSQESQSSSEAY